MLTLVSLASLYLQLSAEFIAVIQILIYAGAILVIFMFVIILFQDAHQQMGQFEAKSPPALLWIAGTTFTLALVFMGQRFIGMPPPKAPITEDFGTVEYLGHALYIDYFFPFEAVIALFLIAIVGALYIGRKALEINFEKKKIGND
jgi:NADH-quinone oxidoreductase subunit J